ncbi:metal-dependent phosphohydrolase [Lysinibacillus sp. MHQ-1]|nr:metal-dependent phosphohydrolase [Lysinibacillus sp. MHQ-1]
MAIMVMKTYQHKSFVIFLLELGFEVDFVLKVVYLVQFHMLIQYGGDRGGSEIYHLLDGDLLTRLYFFP